VITHCEDGNYVSLCGNIDNGEYCALIYKNGHRFTGEYNAVISWTRSGKLYTGLFVSINAIDVDGKRYKKLHELCVSAIPTIYTFQYDTRENDSASS
jgi:hypothetical protein